MQKSKRQYSPWERTEGEDLQVQTALDEASANQMAGLVDELLDRAEREKPEDAKES